jgi:hypothetical protein
MMKGETKLYKQEHFLSFIAYTTIFFQHLMETNE